MANGIETQTHAGIKTMLSYHFVRTNRLDKQYAKTFFELFDLRHSNDYNDFTLCDRETVETMLPRAEEYIKVVSELIKLDSNP